MGRFRPCDVCGAERSELFLRSRRLDGPLVRCRSCGHLYVGSREHDFTFSTSDAARSHALAARVNALNIVNPTVEEREDAALRGAVQQERLMRLGRHVQGGSLLDVGCALGDFLVAAAGRFDAAGVEPDPATAHQARARGLAVQLGTLADVPRPDGGFGAITMYHLIEHLDSPRAGLAQARALLDRRGFIAIETPCVDSAFFALAPGRWRQLIPDHYHFFSRATLTRLLNDSGFMPVASAKVSRRVSLRFLADRWRRAGLPAAGVLAAGLAATGLEGHSLRVAPGDIIEVIARVR